MARSGEAVRILALTGLALLVAAGEAAAQKKAPAKKAPPATEKNTPPKAEKSAPPAAEKNGLREPIPGGLPAVVERVEPSVVRLESEHSIGSGVIVGNDGLVLTNHHVGEDATRITVTFSSGKKLESKGYLAANKGRDLLLLKTEPLAAALAIKLAEGLPAKGEAVAAFGTPQGLSFSTSSGIVSAIRSGHELREQWRIYDALGYSLDATWIQHTAAISHGNSGGPLVNMYGELLGLNTWTRPDAQNLNFAIGTPDIKELLAKAESAPRPLTDLRSPAKGIASGSGTPKGRGKGRSEEPKFPSLIDPFPSGRVFSPSLFALDIKGLKIDFARNPSLVVLKHENGSVYAITSVVRKELLGITIGQHDNGKPMVFAIYDRAGQKSGPLETWDRDGKPLFFCQYTSGKPHGFGCFFDDDKLILLLEYKMGELACLRVVVDEQTHNDFTSIEAARADKAVYPLLEKYEAMLATLKTNEINFRKQALKASEQQQQVAASIRNRSVREAGMAAEEVSNAQAAKIYDQMLRDMSRSAMPQSGYRLP